MKWIAFIFIVLILGWITINLFGGFTRSQYNILNTDGTINPQILVAVIDDIYLNFDRKKKDIFTTPPTGAQIREGQLVLYKSGSTYKLFALVQGTTVSVALATN